MKIQSTNDFHETSTVVEAHETKYNNVFSLTAGQVRKARGELCGYSGCTCSGILGVRGRQGGMEFTFYPDDSIEITIPGEE